MRRAEALLMDEAPVMPLYVYTHSELIKPYLMGHWLNYQHRQLFKYWWIDRRWYERDDLERLPNTPPAVERPESIAGGPP
jgi:hypothetical protein